jgi:hypothetical protein
MARWLPKQNAKATPIQVMTTVYNSSSNDKGPIKIILSIHIFTMANLTIRQTYGIAITVGETARCGVYGVISVYVCHIYIYIYIYIYFVPATLCPPWYGS